MRAWKHTEDAIAAVLREFDGGTSGTELCSRLGVSEQTFYLWRKRFSGMSGDDVKRVRELEDENRQLKTQITELTLDKRMLEDVLAKKN